VLFAGGTLHAQAERMSDAAPDKKDDKAAPAAVGGNKKLIIGVIAVNVLLAGVLGYVVVSGRNQAADAAKAAAHAKKASAEQGEGEEGGEEEAEEGGGEAHAKRKFGPLLDVGSFVANLASAPGQPQRYAKVSLSVEALNEEAKARVEGAIVPIKTEALMMLSGAKPEDVMGPDKMMALSEALAKRANKLIGAKSIKRVYFSELVIQ
jgi:flagellar basal body-associated protein FliL